MMNHSIARALAIFAAVCIAGCQEEKFTEKGIPELGTVSSMATDGGIVFEGEILSSGSEAILEHGFTWSEFDDPRPCWGHDLALAGPAAGPGPYSLKVTADIRKGVLYHVRSFMVTETRTSLGPVTTFTGTDTRAPEILSVTPSEAVCGDTVVITGHSFSYKSANNVVRFGNRISETLHSRPDTLLVKVPPANEAAIKISVSVSGQASPQTLDFTVTKPILTSFSPSDGTFRDTVTLEGNGFSLEKIYTKVNFNGVPATIVGMTRTHYKVLVPTCLVTSPCAVQIVYFNSFRFSEMFTLKNAVIENVSRTSARSGDTITLRGKYFNPDRDYNTVRIGDRTAAVIASSAGEISIIVPSDLQKGSYPLSLTTLQGQPVTWPEPIGITSRWDRMRDFPGEARSSPAVFATSTHGYVGTGHNVADLSDFWEYDPSSDGWLRIADFPVRRLDFGSGFAIGGKGFVTLGKVDEFYNSELKMFDPAVGTWLTRTTRPGQGSSMKAPVFVIDGKAYSAAAEEMYMYDPGYNNWAKRSYPYQLKYFGSGVAFALGGKGYMGVGWIHQDGILTPMLFEYDPATDTWTRKADFPGTLRSNAVFFTLPNGKAYVGLGTTLDYVYLKDMWEYDPVADRWRRIEDFPGTARYSAVAFTVGGTAYVGFGYDGTHQKDIWAFNPAPGN